MPRSSFDRKQLSRSKVDLYIDCPRCFYEDVVRRNPRPSGPSFTLNIAVDLDAVPLQDPRMDAWRTNFTGVRWLDDATGWTLCGAVDDVWLGGTKYGYLSAGWRGLLPRDAATRHGSGRFKAAPRPAAQRRS